MLKSYIICCDFEIVSEIQRDSMENVNYFWMVTGLGCREARFSWITSCRGTRFGGEPRTTVYTFRTSTVKVIQFSNDNFSARDAPLPIPDLECVGRPTSGRNLPVRVCRPLKKKMLHLLK